MTRAANATVEVKEWRDEIVFLYRVVMGAADRSYGIHVAKLAGLPPPVLARATEVLERAGEGRRPAEACRLSPTTCRCSRRPRAAPRPRPTGPRALEQALAALSPDAMTPKEALEALYRLKALLASEP